MELGWERGSGCDGDGRVMLYVVVQVHHHWREGADL